MIKFLKKAASALLASIMCMPTGIVNVSSAAQSNPDGSYTVTLTDTENGLVQFSEESMNNSTASQDGYQMMQVGENGKMQEIENDGSLWAFNEGDNVEIECIPDNGYYVESLTLKDSDSGKTLSQKDTINNVFSFEMPDKNVSVEAVFSSTATINIKDDKKSKSSDVIEYHDVVEDMDISKDEIEEVVADVVTESYIKSNINENYITINSDDIRMANVLYVKNTLFDGQYVEKNDTIDSIMGSIEAGDKDMYKNAQKFIAQLESYVVVYDFDASSDYYVAYANTMIKDSGYTVQDLCVAINSTEGIVIENGYVYDESTGLLYIPKDLYRSEEEKGKEVILKLQVQFMQVSKQQGRSTDSLAPENMMSGVNQISVDEEEEQIELSSYNQEIFAMETDITVEKGMDSDNLTVLVNGLPVAEGDYTYNPETGGMTIAGSPASITSVEVTEGESSLSDELLDFIDETEAEWSISDIPSAMELPDPVEEDLIEVLKKPIFGMTTWYYYDHESGGLLDDIPGATIYKTPCPYYDGSIEAGERGVRNIIRYINGLGGVDGATVEGEDYHLYEENNGQNLVFFINLSNFSAEGTIDGGSALNSVGLTEEQKGEVNKFIQQFGELGYLQCKCGHAAAIGESAFDTDGRDNARPVTPNARIGIRLLYDQHDEKEGYFVFGVYCAEAKYTTQIGAGVFKVHYKVGTVSSNDPFYLYLYKKGSDGKTIKGAKLSDAKFEMKYYEKRYNSAASALASGAPKATFTFETRSTEKKTIGTKMFRELSKDPDIKADFGIDFTPMMDDEGSYIKDEETGYYTNHFLTSSRAEYTEYFGKQGTYVISEQVPPIGYSLAGEMSGYQNGKKTERLQEGLALYIEKVTEENNGEEYTYNKYYLNNKEFTTKILQADNMPDPDNPKYELDTGAALITEDNPTIPELSSNAICTDTMSQNAGSAYRTINVVDSIRVKTVPRVNAWYKVTTKLYNRDKNEWVKVKWKNMNPHSQDASADKEFEFVTTFHTEQSDITDGDNFYFDVGASVDITEEMKGDTLVFVNYLLVAEGTSDPGNNNDKVIWPKNYNNALDDATGEEKREKRLGEKSSIYDELEEIRIIDGISTSIKSNQTKRKANTGESITYAGKYKNHEYKEGHGEILQELTDTITYDGLEKGKEYRIKAWLVDAETGNPINVEKEESLKSSSTGSGTWDITFKFDTTGNEGKKYVSYVEVYDNDNLILEHKKLNDKKETFMIPKITTKLRCMDSNTSIAPLAETMNFEDTITYKNLIPNANYSVKTVVMDLETGKELVDAKGNKALITGGQTLTPSAENGEHKVKFSIAGVKTDSNGIVTNTIAGKTIVVYQYLFIEQDNNGSGKWVLVAEHADMDDKDQSMPISGSGPLYLYLYKKDAGGDKISTSSLAEARFKILFYKDQKFTSASEAVMKGRVTAEFEFKTASAKDANLGSAPYRNTAGIGDINAEIGIDCYPKVDEAGNFIYGKDANGNQVFQNDFLTSGNLYDYTRYFGQAGTYVVKETVPPFGYSLSGEMKGYGSTRSTPNITEGLAVIIEEKVNSQGKIIHQYKVDGELVKTPILNVNNVPDPNNETGLAIITEENPEDADLSTKAVCLDTMQQYASSDSRTVSLLDTIKVRTVERADAKYTITTKLYDLTSKRFLEVHWKNKSKYSDPDSTGESFETNFSTNGHDINAGDTVTFDVAGIVDGTALKGHDLVFINYMVIHENSDGSGKAIWGIDAQGNVLNGGLGKATSEDDKLEMISFPDQRTDIISTQNKRKGIHGEGIIYAGMYKDDTMKEGHGTRFQTLADTIYYKNYQPGREYTVRAWLMDVNTKAPALDANNNEIFNMQATQKQVASSTGDGSWDISFEFDATGCGDRKYVSFVEIFLGSELVASYKDIGDETESFLIPKITTKLKDNSTGMDISYAGETVSLTDTISYSKMMVGADYKVETKVIDMETKKELVDVNGNVVKVPEQRFTAEDESGTVDIPISFAALTKNSDGTIKKTLAGKTIVVYEYVYIEKEHNGTEQWVLIADHEDFEDENQRAYLPYIDTLALDEKTKHHISNAGVDMKIHDTVNYKKLNPKYKYRLESELRDKSTGEVVVDDTNTKQIIKTPVTIDTVDGTIKPEENGVIFDLSAKSFAGRTLVVFERLYLVDGDKEFLVADHEDLLDKDQTDHIPKVWTKAMVKDIFGTTEPDRARIIDTFSYENLIPGLTYKLKGKVIDKNQTIQAGTDILAGGAATNELTFVPESSSGSVRLSFDIPKLNSGVFVVYEELYVVANYDGTDHEVLVAEHTDIDDLNQTVYPNPTIATSLLDTGTEGKVVDARENACLTDIITYRNFDPRNSYTIRGQLINMETGSVLTDSKDARVEAEKDVIPDSTGTGQWEMEYRFDASKLSGTVIVAFEQVYEHTDKGTRLVASHKNFWDKEQRAYIPAIDTVALNPKTNGHIADAEGNMIITDRVYYSHLELGTEYRLVSRLVDKKTKETVVDDKGILQEMETTFSTTENASQEKYAMELQNPFDSEDGPKKAYAYGYVIPEDGNRLPDGTAHKGVVFKLDAHTFEGRTLVVFEELQKRTKDGYVTVARHMDIDDADQTIHVPKIRTHAFDSETGTNISKMDGSITIHDYVAYENLLPGQTYVLKASLMDKPDSDTKTESQIKDANGDYITGTLEFVPDSPNGTAGPVILQGNADHFMTDEGEFSSETLVVYEELYLKDSRDASDELLAVADHKDINDENQTIYHPTIRTKAVAYNLGEEPKDGDRNHAIGFAAYKCDYCGTKFYTSQEAEAHLRQSQICQRKGSYSIVSQATIYDTVYYENLMPNRTYEIVGQLIDVRTGKTVKINQKQVQSDQKSFTQGTGNGEVDGKKEGKRRLMPKIYSRMPKTCPTLPKIHSKLPKTPALLPNSKFLALSIFPHKCFIYRLFSISYTCNLPKIYPKMPKIFSPLPKTKFLAFTLFLHKCPVNRLLFYSYKCNLPKPTLKLPKIFSLLPNLKFLAFHQSLTNAHFIGFPEFLTSVICQKHLPCCQKSNFWHFLNITRNAHFIGFPAILTNVVCQKLAS